MVYSEAIPSERKFGMKRNCLTHFSKNIQVEKIASSIENEKNNPSTNIIKGENLKILFKRKSDKKM